MTHTIMKQVNSNRWEDENGNYIYKDEFDSYKVYVNGNYETTNSLRKALNIVDSDRYWDEIV